MSFSCSNCHHNPDGGESRASVKCSLTSASLLSGRELIMTVAKMQENNLKAKNGLNDISDFKKIKFHLSVT